LATLFHGFIDCSTESINLRKQLAKVNYWDNNYYTTGWESKKSMDFEKLAEIIPKLSSTWTVEDTQKWLQFTGLQILS
jgi:hypothetical protein